MTYGQDLALFVGAGPAIRSAKIAAEPHSSRKYAAWRSLDSDRRLAVVEAALTSPANDNNDGFPVAL